MNVSRSQTRTVDQGAWEEHFKRMASDTSASSKGFYRVKSKTNKDEGTPVSESVRLVSETAASLAQARGQVAQEAKLLKLQPALKDMRPKRKAPLKRKNRLVASHDDDIFNDG